MRVLASSDIFLQPTRTSYLATRFSRKFRERPARAWAVASLAFMNRSLTFLPDSLQENNYTNPIDITQSAAFKCVGQVPWELFEKNPMFRQMFDDAMEQQDDLPDALIVDHQVDWEGMLGGVSAGELAFVDVGGGSGHALVKLKQQLGDKLKGKLLLQDQPGAVETAKQGLGKGPNPPFECVPINFFTDSPVPGARVYHIRRCLHDWSDDKCEIILKNVRAAMKPGYSRLLIHEFVLPVVGAEQREVLFDLLMMCLTGAERDEAQWEHLMGKAGFKIVKIWKAKVGHMAVIEAEVA
jgi:hypothetical protein